MHLEIQVIALFIFRFQLIWVESDMTRGSFKSFTNNLKPICEFCQLFVKADVKENNMGSFTHCTVYTCISIIDQA